MDVRLAVLQILRALESDGRVTRGLYLDLNIACFLLSFSCGYYAVSSVSVSSAVTRFAHDMYRIVIHIMSRTIFFIYFIFCL